MFIFIYAIWGMYFLFLVLMIYGWFSKQKPIINTEKYSVAVIVPFRNEEENLARLIKMLSAQVYTNFEVIFVNDHSDDDSIEIIKECAGGTALKWHLIAFTETEGKKGAIEAGIEYCKSEIIVTTDADCWMGPGWLAQINSAFDKRTNMVAGPVVIDGDDSLFNYWQQLEFSTLIGTGGAMMNLNFPMMCNGANLAYRRLAFEKVNGFEGIRQTPSGDDELLMSKFKGAFLTSIKFINNKEAVVFTHSAMNWKQFKHQRKRWSSKWKMNKRPETILVALLIMIFHLTFIFTVIQAVRNKIPIDTLIVLLGIKFFLEFVFTKSVAMKLGNTIGLTAFLVSKAFYSFYAILFGLTSNFGKYDWKGRTYKI